jgi:hypothetical protein
MLPIHHLLVEDLMLLVRSEVPCSPHPSRRCEVESPASYWLKMMDARIAWIVGFLLVSNLSSDSFVVYLDAKETKSGDALRLTNAS